MALYRSPSGTGLLKGPEGHPTSDINCCICGEPPEECKCWSSSAPVELFWSNSSCGVDCPQSGILLYWAHSGGYWTTSGYLCDDEYFVAQIRCVDDVFEFYIEIGDVVGVWTPMTYDENCRPCLDLTLTGLTICGGSLQVTVCAESTDPGVQAMNLIRSPQGRQATLSPETHLRTNLISRVNTAPRKPTLSDWFRRLCTRLGVPRRCGCDYRQLDAMDLEWWTKPDLHNWMTDRLMKEAERLQLDADENVVYVVAGLLISKAIKMKSPVGS